MRWAYPFAGYGGDQEKAERYLEFGKPYTLEKLDIHESYTYIFLQEVPDVSFNDVLFAPAEEH